MDKNIKIIDKIVKSESYQKLVNDIFNLVYEFTVKLEEEKKDIVKEEVKKNTKKSDVAKAFNIPEGTSCLIKLPEQNIIFIARRNKKQYSTENCVCIDDKQREKFFAVLRENKIKKHKGLYAILKTETPELYEVYESYIQGLFEAQL